VSDQTFAAFGRRLARGLGGTRGRDRILEEALDHLEEAAAEEEGRGANPDAARRRAVERFGDPEATAAAFPEARVFWLPAVIGLLTALALLVVGIDLAQQVARPCGGVQHAFCDSTLPLSASRQVHPLRARLDAAAAVSAAILAAAFGVAAWRQRRRRTHTFEAAVAAALGEPNGNATIRRADAPPRRAVHVCGWIGAATLTSVILVAVGAAVRGTTVSFATPRQVAYPLQRGAVPPARSPRLVGAPDARSLLRWILTRMPTGFATIGVKTASAAGLPEFHGNYLITTEPSKAPPAMTEAAWETDVVARAYRDYQHHARWSAAPPITGAFSNGGGPLGSELRYYTPPNPSALRATITANARREGLTPTSITLPQPAGVAPIVIARTAHPFRYLKHWPQLLPNDRFIGSLLIIEGSNGYVRVVLASQPNTSYTWADSPPNHPR
jgi:hypothetical protein